MLCVGPYGEEHSLYRFKVAALVSEAPDTLNLAAQWLAASVRRGDTATPWELSECSQCWSALDPDAGECLEPGGELGNGERVDGAANEEGPRPGDPADDGEASDGASDDNAPDDDHADGGAGEDYGSWRDSAEELVRSTWALLIEGCGADFTAAYSDRSAADWGRLMTYVAGSSVRLVRPSPIVTCCNAAATAGGAPSLDPELAAALVECKRAEVEETVAFDGGGDAQLTDAQVLGRILAQPEAFFPPFEALALMRDLPPHSCIPSRELRFAAETGESAQVRLAAPAPERPLQRRGLELELVSLRSGEAQRTLARVECVGLDVEERQFELAACGLAPCYCVRCKFESGGSAAESVSESELRVLLEVAQTEERYADAEEVLDAILERKPNDGDALYERSRLAGWQDQWSEARRLLAVAAELAPGNARVEKLSGEASCYFDGGEEEAAVVQDPDGGGDGEGGGGDDEGIFVVPDLLVGTECRRMVELVEAHLDGAWTTQRHFAVPTNDIPVAEVAVLRDWFNVQLEHKLFPWMGRCFEVDPAALRVIDAFLVKYDAAKQRSLPLHCDQSEFSLTVSMNPLDEYEGGGTYFAKRCAALNCDVGGVVGFRGSLLHGGHPITAGKRYIIVVFAHAMRGAG